MNASVDNQNFVFSPENQKAFDELLTRYPTKMAALLPTLWLAQKQVGYLPLYVQRKIAQLLDLHPAHVYGVVSFYTMFKDKPVGQYHLQVCRTLCCALAGSEPLIQHLQDALHIKNGETTADGRFSLELVECLASCGTGPVIQVNETYVENVTTDVADQLIAKLRMQE